MIKSTPRFSILLPTHNRSDVIHCAIESVLAQTDSSFELLIVGDGCTDDTSKIVKPYLGDKRILWFDFPKGPGFGYNHRNTVLKKTKGKYIAFVGHDDILLQDHLQILGERLDSNKEADIVYSRPLWVDRRGQIMPSHFNLNNKQTLRLFVEKGNSIPAVAFIHRRNCFEKVGYWDEEKQGIGDWDLWKRIIASKNKQNVLFEDRPTTLHFLASWREGKQHEQSIHVAIVDFAKKNNYFPHELKEKVPKGIPEQIAFWRRICLDPEKWAADVRRATDDLGDAVIYYGIQEIERLRGVENHHKELKEAHDGLIKVVSKQNKTLEEVQNSLTFRLHAKFFSKIVPNSRLHRGFKGVVKRLT